MKPRGWSLPEEYEYISYLSTNENDTIYIDTEFGDSSINPKNVELEVKFSSRGGTNTVSAAIFGFRVAAGNNQFALFDSGASVSLSNRYATQSTNIYTAAQGMIKGNVYTYKMTLEGNYKRWYIDGVMKGQSATHGSKLGRLYLFACNENDSGSVTNVNGIRTIYYFKLWYEGTLIRDFIPVRRIEDGKLGMFDKITNRFFTSPNGHNFVTGGRTS